MSTLPPLRDPRDRRALWFALLFAGLVTAILTPFTAGGVVLLILAGIGFNWLSTARNVARIRRTAAPIERFPELEAIVRRCLERLEMDEPVRVFVAKSDKVNAFATGSRAPYTVVLYTGLIEAFDEDELAFVIGHELGHVKCRHTTLLTLLGQLGYQSYGVRGVNLLFYLAFLSWRRAGEYSADRAGLIACGRLDKALSTQLVLSMGRAEARRVNMDALIRHFQSKDVGLVDSIQHAMSTHPGAEARLDALVDFATEIGAAPPLAAAR